GRWGGGWLRGSGLRPARMTLAPSARARRAVSSPMPELPPMTTTIWPSNSGSRWVTAVVAVVMIPPVRGARDRIANWDSYSKGYQICDGVADALSLPAGLDWLLVPG